MSTMAQRVARYVDQLQESIVTKLETYSPNQKFRRERWTRSEGGGGLSCTLDVAASPIEKAGVNVSTIHNNNNSTGLSFITIGLSLVLHPRHPRIPTVHANYRYVEVVDADHAPASRWWFGVVTDLTPAYPDEPAFCHFHTTLKGACDAWRDAHVHVHAYDLSVYPAFKASCDGYFYLPHRHEHRGIGGVRFDNMDTDAMRRLLRAQQGQGRGGDDAPEDTIARLSTQEALFDLVKALGDSFLPSFIPIFERRMHDPIVPSERRWQLLRRGRAVEFSLVVDRGTKFGLTTPGILAENVLVGMPPEARWEYCSELGAEDQDTEEAEMVSILKVPRNWVV